MGSKSRLAQELNQVDLRFLFVHNQFITKASLDVFGNNYYGLRLPVVLYSLGIILLLFLIIRTLIPDRTIVFLIVVLMLTEFSFGSMSRFQNPQVYSIFYVTLVIYLVHLYSRTSRRIFRIMAVAISLFATVLVYPYVLFVSIGITLAILGESLRSKSSKPIVDGLVGSLFFIGMAGVTLALANQSPMEIWEKFAQINSVRNERVGLDFIEVLRSVVFHIPFTNLFRFNLILLFILILFFSQIVLTKKTDKKRGLKSFIVFCLISAFTQSALISSYPFKKWILIFPVIVIALAYCIRSIESATSGQKLALRISLGFFCIAGFLNWKITNTAEYWSGMENYQFIQVESIILYSLILLPILAILFLVLHKRKNLAVKVLLTGAILNGTLMSANYFFVSRTHSLRDLLVRNSDTIDGKLILGSFSHAFSFYNTGTVLQNPYDISVWKRPEHVTHSFVEHANKKSIFIVKSLNSSKGATSLLIYGRNLSFLDSRSGKGLRYSLYKEID